MAWRSKHVVSVHLYGIVTQDKKTVISGKGQSGVPARVRLTVLMQEQAIPFTHSGYRFSRASLSFSLEKALGLLYENKPKTLFKNRLTFSPLLLQDCRLSVSTVSKHVYKLQGRPMATTELYSEPL